VHRFDDTTKALALDIVDYVLERIRVEPPLDHPRSPAELRTAAGRTVTPDGLGGTAAFAVFTDVLAPACLSVDHPRFLSFVPAAPTEASILFDVVVAASSIYGGSWLEGAGAVFAENEALRWVADLAGLPDGAGGCFVSGATAGNLSALVAARDAAGRRRVERGIPRPHRWLVAAASSAHSSVAQAARVMDVDVVEVPVPEVEPFRGEALATALAGLGDRAADVFAVVATAGTTNLGVVDDLDGIGRVCERHGIWFHVDGAYGGAALAAPSVRDRFAGVERADSFVVDPHKWLFAPFDACALVYRDPDLARAAHTQHAGYLDVLTDRDEWNPSDYAHHLSRRARGLPFWFSLAVHGTDAYRDAVETTLRVAREGAGLIRAAPHLELLVEPRLSILAFRRTGWSAADYRAWSDRMLAEGTAFCVPTTFEGEPAMRLCIVNPRTTVADLAVIIDTLA
jgi:glutamate/tyrosine decarboxylase-like PLP-dependent enzyme